ncbi:MAG: hypothetical protein ACOC1P_00320 [Minisyncoccales bacterium]
MKVETIINKETKKAYLTKEGQELQDFILEVGDIILPQSMKPKYIPAGDGAKYPEYRLMAKVKSLGKEVVTTNTGSDLIYLRISQTMANQLNGLIEKAGVNIKEKLFEVVEDVRKSDGEKYKKLKIINPQTENKDFSDFEEDGTLKN